MILSIISKWRWKKSWFQRAPLFRRIQNNKFSYWYETMLMKLKAAIFYLKANLFFAMNEIDVVFILLACWQIECSETYTKTVCTVKCTDSANLLTMSAVHDQITKYQIWHLIFSTFIGGKNRQFREKKRKKQCKYKEHADISKVTQLSYLFGLSDLNLQ